MTSHYLEQPLRPLPVVLPRLLAQIEAELSTAAEPAEEQWLRQRAELIRRLLAPRPDLGEVLRRDRLPGRGATASRP